MNNVMGHFATAYFNYYLKGDVSMLLFLDVHPDGAKAVYAIENGSAEKTHNYWRIWGTAWINWKNSSAINVELLGRANVWQRYPDFSASCQA